MKALMNVTNWSGGTMMSHDSFFSFFSFFSVFGKGVVFLDGQTTADGLSSRDPQLAAPRVKSMKHEETKVTKVSLSDSVSQSSN